MVLDGLNFILAVVTCLNACILPPWCAAPQYMRVYCSAAPCLVCMVCPAPCLHGGSYKAAMWVVFDLSCSGDVPVARRQLCTGSVGGWSGSEYLQPTQCRLL